MTIETQVAGITFRIKENPELATFKPAIGSMVRLVVEPSNEHDPLAVMVCVDYKIIGYLPSGSIAQKAFHEGEITSAKILRYSYALEDEMGNKEFNDRDEGVLGSITLEMEVSDKYDFRNDPNNFYEKDGKRYLRITKFLEVVKDKYDSGFDHGISEKEMSARAEYGDVIHDLAHALTEQWSSTLGRYLFAKCGVTNFLNDHMNCYFVKTERQENLTVFSDVLKLAGTVDVKTEEYYPDEDQEEDDYIHSCIDWKNSMTEKHKFQMAFNCMGHRAKKGYIVNLRTKNKKKYSLSTLDENQIKERYAKITEWAQELYSKMPW